jgi:hypothetical protein
MKSENDHRVDIFNTSFTEYPPNRTPDTTILGYDIYFESSGYSQIGIAKLRESLHTQLADWIRKNAE